MGLRGARAPLLQLQATAVKPRRLFPIISSAPNPFLLLPVLDHCSPLIKQAFRKLYEQVGLGWVYAITKYESIVTIADAVYGVWAKYRLQITGRPVLEKILEARKQNKDKACSDNENCKI